MIIRTCSVVCKCCDHTERALGRVTTILYHIVPLEGTCDLSESVLIKTPFVEINNWQWLPLQKSYGWFSFSRFVEGVFVFKRSIPSPLTDVNC